MDFLARALVPIAVLTVFALARKYMPARPVRRAPHSDYSLQELDTRFTGTQWTVMGGMISVGVIFLVGIHAALVAVNHSLAVSNQSASFLILPQSAIWWFFPAFGALALSWEISLQFWILIGNRADADLYVSWTNQKVGFDSTRMLRWMAVLVVLPIGVLTTLAIPMHTTLSEDRIVDCGYAFAGCKVYRYADARRMTIVDGFRNRDSQLTRRAGIVIDFKDGSRWSSANEGDFHQMVDPSLEEFVRDKTHLSYDHAETVADIPPLTGAQ